MSSWICFGVVIGCGIGIAMGNLALGIGPGIGIGVAIGTLTSKSGRLIIVLITQTILLLQSDVKGRFGSKPAGRDRQETGQAV